MLRNRDIVIISPQRWGGMWVSKHWIASELSRQNRVLFVEPAIWVGGWIRQPFGFEILRKWLLERRAVVSHNLFVFTPVYYPNVLRRSRNPSLEVVEQVRKEIERLGFRDCIVLNFGTNHELVGSLGERTSIYYCVDPPFPAPGEEQAEQEMCNKSDIVMAISEKYRKRLEPLAKKKEIVVVPHGYDYERAVAVTSDTNCSTPSDLKGIRRPILGYVGSLHDAYVDVDLVIEIATRRPGWSFVFIGPHKNNPIGPSMSAESYKRLTKISNVHLLGPKHFRELPFYIKWFDVCLILHNHRLDEASKTRQRTAFKILPYLSQGKPIVAVPMEEFGAIRKLVYVGDTVEGFISGIEQALSEDEDQKNERMRHASQFSFQTILSRIASVISEDERCRELRFTG